ncbi:PREDICTED: protein FAM162A isoform X2 [Cercocebus atys]|uniref:protein FAM162A isoform X1 n=1 Tax=Cercocebus atys TaxID=9531 RepID=UPI0005F3AD47|nr:PREDICTED: protein FAM162A isoform X1 [Cercocebus atys]XP_011923921.1 PREDICTED: protein FAM162A isoform X2 [Cercocebus atys]
MHIFWTKDARTYLGTCCKYKMRKLKGQEGNRLAKDHTGSCFRLCERDVSSSLRLTRSSDLKIINGFCIKPQESPRAPSRTYSHRVPLHKPTDWQKKMLIWSGRFKKEDEIPETVSLEMLDAAKNKMRVKICYLMIALTVIGCIAMIIDGKKAAQRNETLTRLNLEKKARLREEAAMKAKTE